MSGARLGVYGVRNYAGKDGEEKSRWTQIETSFGCKDGSPNVSPRHLPLVDGTINIRLFRERTAAEWRRRSGAPTRGRGQPRPRSRARPPLFASRRSPLRLPFLRSWPRRPKLGVRASIALHLGAMLLCAIAIRAETATTLAWILLWLNAAGAALVGLALWIGELPEGRKPFGPFTELADFLGFLDERTPQGCFVAWLRRRGFFE